ncbi:hypothethical protein (plasmid) [Ralstonia solanacearum CMR15]|nr:hypothethical protein [Ralstonia solanacearum CMR15]
MPRITDSELLLISKAKIEKLKNFADGVSLVRRAQSSIDRLRARVAKDRLTLAKSKLRDAVQAGSCTPPLWRTGAGRDSTFIRRSVDRETAHSKQRDCACC